MNRLRIEHFLFQIKEFYQSRKGQRSLVIPVMGSKIPMYGSGAGLSSSTGTTTLPVNLRLSFVVRSKANVLGKLVRTKFNRRVECLFTYDPKKLGKAITLKNSCKVDS